MPAPDITSLIPIALALGLSLYTRNVIVGLFTGVFVGVLMLNGPNPLTGAGIMVKEHLIPELTDSYNAGVLILLAVIGGFVALVERRDSLRRFHQSLGEVTSAGAERRMGRWHCSIFLRLRHTSDRRPGLQTTDG